MSAPTDTILDSCRSTDAWEGAVELDRRHVKSGDTALMWPFGERGILVWTPPVSDWRAHGNALAFWVYNPESTDYRPQLRIYEDLPDGTDAEAYADLRLDFSGWRRMVIPFSEFRQREPTPLPDWCAVGRVELRADLERWRVGFPPAQGRLILDDIRLTTVTSPPPGRGPRMTDKEFFDRLDLKRPELAAVRNAVSSGNPAAARAAFARHIRTRRSPRWFEMWWERPTADRGYPAWKVKRAEEHRRREFRMSDTLYRAEGRIDWSTNPFTEGPRKTNEYNAALNRFYHFRLMREAFWYAGRDDMVPEMVRQMVEWAQDNPTLFFSDGKAPYHHAWQPLNVAVRLGVYWPDVIYRTLDNPAYTDEAIITLWKSMAEQAEHLLRFPSRNNWLTSESKALAFTGIVNPEFAGAETWRRVGIARLYSQLEREVYPDGAQIELAAGYFRGVLMRFAELLELAAINNRMNDIPDDYKQRLERMYDYFLLAMRPDGLTPARNDSHLGVDARERFAEAARLFPQRDDFLWAATDRKQGTPPAHSSVAFPYAGHMIMRTGWHPQNDLHLMFDGGPWGAGHQHEDKLGFTLYAYGKLLVLEGGTHQYNESAARKYVLSTRAHNTIRVDNGDQRCAFHPETWVLPYPFKPIDNPWFTGPDYDFAQATYDHGYGGRHQFVEATHRRSILFVKPRFWIIVDIVRTADDEPHVCESLLHLNAAPEEVRLTGTLVRTASPGTNLAVTVAGSEPVTLSVVSGRYEPDMQGWSEDTFEKLKPVPTLVASWHHRRVSRLVSVLYPLTPDMKYPVADIALVPVQADGVDAKPGTACRIRFEDGAELTAYVAAGGRGESACASFRTDAVVAVVERNAAGRVTRRWQEGGTFLTVEND